jgi:hypothetical protein
MSGGKLGGDERRLLLAIALLFKRDHQPPTWRQAWKAAGLSGSRAYFTTKKAEAHGYLSSEPNVAHSIRLTASGVQAAVTGLHTRPAGRRNPQNAASVNDALPAEATEVASGSFTSSVTRRAGQGVSLEGGGAVMTARKSFLSAARKEGFVAAEGKLYVRLSPKGGKGTAARLWYHQKFDSFVLASGESMKIATDEDVGRAIQMLTKANAATPVAAKKPAAKKPRPAREKAKS